MERGARPPNRLRSATVDVVVSLMLASLVVGPVPVAATHSVPSPHWFWDGDVNGVPDQYPEAFRLGGAGWYQNAINRTIEAVSHWAVSTNWNPRFENVNTNYFYIDRPPPQPCGTTPGSEVGGWGPGIARVCTYAIYHHPVYNQIWRSNIFIKVDLGFWAGRYQATDPNLYDFRGTVTHELGHALRLTDISSAEPICSSTGQLFATMCPAPSIAYTYHWRTLQTDDINAANAVYTAGP